MNLDDVRNDTKVRIIAGGPEHPLHGHLAWVVLTIGPLPADPPASLQDARMRQIAHLIHSNVDERGGEREARAFRKESLEAPFAWPKGQVLLTLVPGTADKGRRWPFPYITVSPEDIEAV
jgi:hypothetical protein